MALKKMEITQGDSSKTLTAQADGTLDSNWSGKIVVRNKLGSSETDLISIAMTLDVPNNKLYGTLSPSDTAGLTEDTHYILTVEVSNSSVSPAYNKEIKKYDLYIGKQGA